MVNIRAATNVLLGEKLVYAFPEVRENKNIVRKGDVISTTTLQEDELTNEAISKRIKLLLASSFAEVQRRGSLADGLQFNALSINQLAKNLLDRGGGSLILESVSTRESDTGDQIGVALRIASPNSK